MPLCGMALEYIYDIKTNNYGKSRLVLISTMNVSKNMQKMSVANSPSVDCNTWYVQTFLTSLDQFHGKCVLIFHFEQKVAIVCVINYFDNNKNHENR